MKYKKILILTLCGLLCVLNTSGEVAAATKKDETVYAILDNNEEVISVTVTDWLEIDENGEISDYSTLTDIRNVKGDEIPVINGENVVWQAQNDIYYQGESNKELPFDIVVSYYHDGEEVSSQNIAGKSGDIEIKIEYINKEAHNVTINDENRVIYTPFMLASIVTLPVDNFTNVEINGGKIINDGNNNYVAFVTVPGLQDSLGEDNLIENFVELPETLVIKAKANKFELPSIMTAVTTELYELGDIEELNKIQELLTGVEQLKESSGLLAEGATELSNGSSELVAGSELFHNGLLEFVTELSPLASGISELDTNLSTIVDNTKQLDTATTSLADDNGVLKSLRDNCTDLENLIEDLKAVPSTETTVAELETKLAEQRAVIDGLEQGLDQTATAVNGLSVGFETLYDQGVAPLNTKASQLPDALTQLSSGSEQIKDGTKELSDGLKLYSDNMTTFNDEGIDLLYNEVITMYGKVDNLIKTSEELNKLSKEYNNFSGISKEMEGEVKFIIKTLPINSTIEQAEPDTTDSEPTNENQINEELYIVIGGSLFLAALSAVILRKFR